MKITHIDWSDETILHIARHGVEPEEIGEICFGTSPWVIKARRNRYFALGQTGSGRYLAIVFEYLGKGRAIIITARPMDESERKLYKRS